MPKHEDCLTFPSGQPCARCEGYRRLDGGTMPFMRAYTTICP